LPSPAGRRAVAR